MDKVKVTIDGNEYSLVSENSSLLNQAVDIVDNNIKSIRSEYKNKLNNETMIVLSSLNIAENMLLKKLNYENEKKILNSKLNELVQQLEKILD